MILFLLYAFLGYWATGVTIYANKIVIHSFGQLFLTRLILGIFLGIILIPVALIKVLLLRK